MTTNQLKKTKARNNEGSIFKKTLKDGTVVHIVEISLGMKANGKRRRTQKTFKTLSEAKQGRVQMLNAQQEGRLTEVRNETVYTYGLWWAREVKPQHIRETTAADYEDRLRRYVFPFLGSIRMVDLKTEHIVRWMNELKKSGKSTNTINGARRVLTGMCKYAARTGVIPFNPVLATDSMRRQGVLGYIATRAEYPYGGYEPTVAQRGYGHPAPFAPEAGEMIAAESIALLNQLFKVNN